MNAELKRASTERNLFADWSELAIKSDRITRDEEVLRFKQLQFCAYRLSCLYQRAVKSVRTTIHTEHTLWTDRYRAIRQRLIDANLGLVYDMIGRSRSYMLDRDEMTSEGMLALLRAVETFDPWRGYRLSTYACNSILRAFARRAQRDWRRRARSTVQYDPELDVSDVPEAQREEKLLLYIERLGHILKSNGANLSPTEQGVLSLRFPSKVDGERLTFARIGARTRLSTERIRQIQRDALRKLRHAFQRDKVLQ